MKFFSWITSLLVTDLIILSEKELRQTAKLPFAARKATRIYLGINPPDFLPHEEARAIIAAKINKPTNFFNSKTIIGTISELHPNKGLEYAIRAIAALQNCAKQSQENPSLRNPQNAMKQSSAEPSLRGSAKQSYNNLMFIIIGSGDLEPKLKTLIQELNLTETIFLTGFISDASRLLKAFDIFTLTSLKEGLPYAVLEAGAADVPIIASAVGGIPEVINSKNCGNLIAPKDTPAIAAALTDLIGNPALRTQKSTLLKTRLAIIFTPQQMLEKTLALYKK